MFHTWGASGCPPVCLSPSLFVFKIPPVCSDAPWSPICSNTPICPQCSPAHLHVQGVSACDWGCRVPPFCLDTPMCLDASPCVQDPPHISMLPCMSVCCRGYLHVLWGKLSICWGSGGISTSVKLWCQYIHWISIMLHLVPFLWFIVSQVSTSTAITASPVTVVSSGMSSLSSVTMAPSLMGFPTMLGQHDVVMPPPLTPRCFGGVLGHASVPLQQPSSSMPLQANANCAMGSPQVEPPTVLYITCLVSFLVSVFYFQVPCWMPFSPLGLNHWGLHHCNPLESSCSRHMCNLVMVIGPHQVCTEWLLPPLHWIGRALCYSVCFSPAILSIWRGIQLWRLGRGHPIPPPSLHDGEGSSFPGLVPSDDNITLTSANRKANQSLSDWDWC